MDSPSSRRLVEEELFAGISKQESNPSAFLALLAVCLVAFGCLVVYLFVDDSSDGAGKQAARTRTTQAKQSTQPSSDTNNRPQTDSENARLPKSIESQPESTTSDAKQDQGLSVRTPTKSPSQKGRPGKKKALMPAKRKATKAVGPAAKSDQVLILNWN